MGISMLTALMIKGNDVQVNAIKYPDDKYGMEILMLKNGNIHTSLLSVDYGFFNSSEEAKEYGEKLVTEIKGMDLSKIGEK